MKIFAFSVGVIVLFNTLYAAHLQDHLLITAKLTGAAEVPAVTTNAVGVASLSLNGSRDTLSLLVGVNGLSSAITGVHIHEGAADTTGPVVIDLMPFLAGNRVSACFFGGDLTPTVISKLLSGQYYVNVHTSNNPNGEIRGQLILETDWAFRASLDTMQETSAVISSNARGLGAFRLSHDHTSMEVRVVADGLSGPITSAHFHYGAMNVGGGIAITLSHLVSGSTLSGTVDVTAAADFIDSLLAGNIYINLHTNSNPDGEIRGQLILDSDIAFDAWLDTAQETDPVTGSDAKGLAIVSITPAFDVINYAVIATGMSGTITGAHFHEAGVGVPESVVVNLTSSINGNIITGTVTGASVTPSLIRAMLSGNSYINLHTTINPNGEIRGQLYRTAREGYTIALDGAQEVSPVATAANGVGIASVDRDQTNVHFMIVVNGLSGAATGAHFHDNVVGEDGGVIHDISSFFSLDHPDDAAFGYWKNTDINPFTPAAARQFRTDSVYVNVHTAANTGGEIRGQVARGTTCYAISTGIEAPHVSSTLSLTAYPNPVDETMVVTFNQEVDRAQVLRIYDVFGKERMTFKTNPSGSLAIDMKQLPAGTYFMKAGTAENQVVQVLVKN